MGKITPPPIVRITTSPEPRNCQNCGAPLHGDKCEYCGTEYRTNKTHQ